MIDKQMDTVASSRLCKQADCESEPHARWAARLQQPRLFHRKVWEWAYICATLDEAGLLVAGKRGLGFGVGREPLPAFFAGCGVDVVATDAPGDASSWRVNELHSADKSELPWQGLCTEPQFDRYVRHAFADMNEIPGHLAQGEYDFCWSASSLDHLGSIQKGLAFLRNGLRCLRPGGLAVHTTEYNLLSNERTLDNGPIVLFRRRDLEALQKTLCAEGHQMEIDFSMGDGERDLAVMRDPHDHKRDHLALELAGHTFTSIGLTVKKHG